MEIALVVGTGSVVLVTLGVLVRVYVRQQAAIDRLDERLANLTAGVALLTDTAEGGFRDIAFEIGRDREAGPPRSRTGVATQRRVAGAAQRGRSVREIAAAEELSEGEVRLRLHLTGDQVKAEHAALR